MTAYEAKLMEIEMAVQAAETDLLTKECFGHGKALPDCAACAGKADCRRAYMKRLQALDDEMTALETPPAPAVEEEPAPVVAEEPAPVVEEENKGKVERVPFDWKAATTELIKLRPATYGDAAKVALAMLPKENRSTAYSNTKKMLAKLEEAGMLTWDRASKAVTWA